MTPLSSEQALKVNATSDPNSVQSLKLTYRALSDVQPRPVPHLNLSLSLSLNDGTIYYRDLKFAGVMLERVQEVGEGRPQLQQSLFS